jgi:sigma-B regulation protein RsbU (phosphoserine phosphatase)
LDGFEYREQSITLEPGDALVLFTDGVTDAEDANGRQFGKPRLASCLDALAHNSSANTILEAVRKTVAEFVGGAQAADDLTLLVVRWRGSASATNEP